MNRKTTLSLAASLLLLAGSVTPAMARDDQPTSQQQSRPATSQRGGLVGNLPGASDQQATAPTVAPSLPIEEAPAPAAIAPSQQATVPSSQVAPSLPALEPELPAAAPRSQLPALGEAPSNQLPAFGELPASALPALGEEAALPPAQAAPSEVSQVASSEAQPEKKPGFFKRMWAKVKTFYANVKTRIGEKVASFRAKRAERAAERAQAAGNAQHEYTPVFDADIHGGGGDGAGAGASD